jgi:probable HAF family extracellular repeat protein
MRLKKRTVAAATTLFTALVMPIGMAAQDSTSQNHKHHQYKLIDLGTFGGPNSFVNGPTVPIIANNGTYGGVAETAIPDPYAPNCQNGDCLVQHAQKWQNGVVTDLGTLPGANLSSSATWVSGDATITGFSRNGLIDPLGIPEMRAVVWTKENNIVNLGTLPGGHQSFANAANERKQIGGWSTNGIPDAFSMTGLGYQTRSVLWQDGVMRDLGTLGGPDALLAAMNETGQIIGNSYTSSVPNSDSGVPTIDPFFWQNGAMVDMGSFGGTYGVAIFINSGGQVVGSSNLAGDQTYHPFLWHRGSPIRDLGTLGGDNAEAAWINDTGEVVGDSDLTGSLTHDGFLWKNGVMTDLGNLGQSSKAYAINSEGQIVGHSEIDDGSFHAFLWEKGGPMVDLNDLVVPASDIIVEDPYDINDNGEIAVTGFLPNGDEHAVLLVPDGECGGDCEARIAASRNNAAPVPRPATSKQDSESRIGPVTSFRNRLGRLYHVPAPAEAPGN